MRFDPIVLAEGTPIPAHGYLLFKTALSREELSGLAQALEHLSETGEPLHLQDVAGDDRRGYYAELVIEREEGD